MFAIILNHIKRQEKPNWFRFATNVFLFAETITKLYDEYRTRVY